MNVIQTLSFRQLFNLKAKTLEQRITNFYDQGHQQGPLDQTAHGLARIHIDDDVGTDGCECAVGCGCA